MDKKFQDPDVVPENGLPLQQSKCKACMECCEYLEIPTTIFNNPIMDYHITRGTQFGINSAGILTIRVHQPCVHLNAFGINDGCGIYENRPEVCRKYLCAPGDSSIKKIKDDQCEDARVKVQRAIKQHTKDNK